MMVLRIYFGITNHDIIPPIRNDWLLRYYTSYEPMAGKPSHIDVKNELVAPLDAGDKKDVM